MCEEEMSKPFYREKRLCFIVDQMMFLVNQVLLL